MADKISILEQVRREMGILRVAVDMELNALYQAFEDYAKEELHMDGKIGSAIPKTNWQYDMERDLREYQERICSLELETNGLNEKIMELENVMINVRRKPHKCPICNGKGGTVISGMIDEECHACDGIGIVWS